MKFAVTLTPITASPLLRKMHRQTRHVEASSLVAARRLVREAMSANADWVVEVVEKVIP